MIWWEEKVEPFYPPETIAIVIADILRKNQQANITICLYRSAAEKLNNAGDAYYTENEQINHIKQSLRKLDIAEEAIDRILFIPSDTDSETQKILAAFSEWETTQNTTVKRLEDLYRENADFQKAVHDAILSKFRGEPLAYKYVLFELAMMIIHQPKVKAGDIREKKYDEIMRRFQKKIQWEEVWEDDGKQPFQTIYWNRDNCHKKYTEYLAHREAHNLARRKQKINNIRSLVAWTVLAFLSTSWGAYWFGKSRWFHDAKYRTIASMNQQNDDLYSTYKDELRLINPSWSGWQYMLSKNHMINSTVAREVADAIIAKTKLLNLPVDTTRFSVYGSMVYEIVNTYRGNRIFESRSIFESTVWESRVLKAAKKFLISPITSSHALREIKFDDSFSEWLYAWYMLTIDELQGDIEKNLRYMIVSDMHQGGIYFSWPDSHIPERRNMLLIMCESFFPRWATYRNYDVEVVAQIKWLYKLLLPIVEKKQWDKFEYFSYAVEYMTQDPEVIEILRMQWLSVADLKSPEKIEQMSQWSFWLSWFNHFHTPTKTEQEILANIQKSRESEWGKNKIFLKEIGWETPQAYLERLRSTAQQYIK